MLRNISCAIAILAVGAITSLAAEPPHKTSPAGDWEFMRSIQPPEYLCHATHEPIVIDARAREAAWTSAAWTEEFSDIEGPRGPRPRLRTRAKMLWDDQYFYVYAELEEPNVWATLTKKNDLIYHDNNFEVFIDPKGSNHHYYEFEINALGTLWELSLDKPYRDGGPAHNPNNLPGLRTAVHIRGTLNDPSDTDRGWSAEAAFPWSELKQFAGTAVCPPHEGDTWRINFSRAEWQLDVVDGKYRKVPEEKQPPNFWVWSAIGVFNMHAPERYGRVQFTRQPAGQGKFTPDDTAAARDELMELYHRQRVFHDQHKRYARSLAELAWPPGAASGVAADDLQLTPTESGYLATVRANLPDRKIATLHTREDSLLWQDAATTPVDRERPR